MLTIWRAVDSLSIAPLTVMFVVVPAKDRRRLSESSMAEIAVGEKDAAVLKLAAPEDDAPLKKLPTALPAPFMASIMPLMVL
jgi:hypothetical protein